VRKSVLIAGYDRNTLTGLADVLEEREHDVTIAHGPMSAIDMARQQWPSVAILDMSSSESEGFTLVRQLRQTAGSRPLLLIALTGWRRDEKTASEFDVCLIKPVGLDQLGLILSIMCEQAPFVA